MDERFTFWVLKRQFGDTPWPADTRSHVFLGNAVNEIGKALFGSDWTGAEPATSLMPLSNRQRERRCLSEEVAKDRAAKRPAMERFSRVKATIIQLAETEQLATALRPKLGGDPVPVHRSLWNSERTDVRFHYCGMSRREPFGNGVWGDCFEYIFVTRESLDRCIAALTAPRQIESAPAGPAPPEAMAPKPRGKKRGDGSYAPLDEPILDEMEALISGRVVASADAAAKRLASKAHGGGSIEAKATRLAKAYRARKRGDRS